LDPERWRDNKTYLYGLDLFNAGYYWEAHEAWEALWHAAGRKGATADFLKGLIKLAAAGVKHLEGKPPGVKSHARRSAALFGTAGGEQPAAGERCFGFPLAALIELADTICRRGWPDEPPLLLPAFDPRR
jgi:hypothetical protein